MEQDRKEEGGKMGGIKKEKRRTRKGTEQTRGEKYKTQMAIKQMEEHRLTDKNYLIQYSNLFD